MAKRIVVLMTCLLFVLGIAGYGFSEQFKAPVENPKDVKTVENPIDFPAPYIPILKDLKYQADKSALLKTTKILTGMLVYKGRYKAKDLVDFFRTQMASQGWHEVGSFTSKMTFLAYKRPEGTAFISITEGPFYTEVRIVVVLSLNDKR